MQRFDGLVVVTDRHHPEFCDLLSEVRQRGLPTKTILQVLGCRSDDLEPRWLAATDLFIPPELSGPDILARLDQLLSPPA